MTFTIMFFKQGENGPDTVREDVEAGSVFVAASWGRKVAKERGWRYVKVYPKEA